MAGRREWRHEGGELLKPRKIVYDVGEDVHGRTVLLIYEAQGNQSVSSPAQWTIHVLAANQRDEDSVIRGLSAECIRAMAEAVNNLKP